MKLTFIILSVYLLMLPLVPCEDAQECGEDKIALIQSSDHAEHDESESCTPFCYCACCSVSQVFVTHMTAQGIFSPHFKRFFQKENDFISIAVYNIWQPPRVNVSAFQRLNV